MIRICHFADHLNGKQDGVFNHIMQILLVSDKTKIKHYLCFQGDSYIENVFKEYGGEIILLPDLTKKISAKAFTEFYNQMKKYEIDIIHTHFLKPYAIAGLCNIFLKKRMLFNYHGFFIDNVFNTAGEKLLYRMAHLALSLFKANNAAIAPSIRAKEQLQIETKLFRKILTYYNTQLISKSKLNEEIVNRIIKEPCIKIAWIGRIEKEKNLEFAVQLMNKLELQPVKLFVFGEGSLLEKNKEEVNSHQLGLNIEFFGFIEEAAKYLRYMDILLITSKSEGIPFVLWEAMANNIPILSSNVGGIPEILEKENCGMLFENNNLEDALNKIERLVNEPDLRMQFGKNGKEAINQTYTLKNFRDRIEKIYFEL